jgi:hypothetical protein
VLSARPHRRAPESERAIGDREPYVDPAPLQVEQQIAPVLRSLADAIGEADKFLAALPRRADQHQYVLLSVFEACLEMDAFGPDVDVAVRRQIKLLPRGVFGEPMADPDNPAASLPSGAASASEKSPVAIPLRDRIGRSVSIRL